MANKSIKELEDEAEKHFKSAKRWENVAKGAKVAETALGVGAALGGPMALVGRAALKKGMKMGAKKMMGGGTSKGSDLLKKSIVSKNKSKAPAPKDVAAKYVKKFNTRDFKDNVRTKKPSIYPKAAGPVAAGTAAGFVAGNRTAKKNNTDKAKTTKPKGNMGGAAASAGALPGVGAATGAANAARKAKQKAPRATAVARPLKSKDPRFRGYTPKLGGMMQKIDKDGNPIGKPYYAPPRRR
tara:strand:+ start:1494 stop:2213 length:720 start_codon:yes stop_codon:yes gene_type:complete